MRMKTQCKTRIECGETQSKSESTDLCGQMLVLQLGESRHNIRGERVAPKNVRSFTTQLFRIEATRSVPEGTETMDPCFRIRGHEFRSEGILGLRLGWRQRNEEIVECGSRARGTTSFQSIYKTTEDHRQKQCDAEATETEHILHRHGIGKMKRIDVAHLWLQDEFKSNRLKVRRVKSEDNLADIGTKALIKNIIRKHATSMEYIDAKENLKSGGAMGIWDGKSEQADQSSPAQRKTSL